MAHSGGGEVAAGQGEDAPDRGQEGWLGVLLHGPGHPDPNRRARQRAVARPPPAGRRPGAHRRLPPGPPDGVEDGGAGAWRDAHHCGRGHAPLNASQPGPAEHQVRPGRGRRPAPGGHEAHTERAAEGQRRGEPHGWRLRRPPLPQAFSLQAEDHEGEVIVEAGPHLPAGLPRQGHQERRLGGDAAAPRPRRPMGPRTGRGPGRGGVDDGDPGVLPAAVGDGGPGGPKQAVAESGGGGR
mmetsp:Transcript_37868/g.82462  ORF Transcript_37868/g.82462 Transcript_37868/m.82462 type:complete len:239 (+) Transcript_37868:229-945(+)